MKFEEACILVEKYENVKNQAGMSARASEAIDALDRDILKIKNVVENNEKTQITWSSLASGIFEELMRNFYELADGSSKLLNIRKQYDLNPTGPIAKKITKEKSKNRK